MLEPHAPAIADWGLAFYVVHEGPWRCTIRRPDGSTEYPTLAELEDMKGRNRWRYLPTGENQP